jgi:toxin ParE1/3/4
LADLTAIRAHIGADNPFAASRVAVQIVAACDRLQLMPERGRPGLDPSTRELTSAWPYVIVYRITSEAVEVLRIWHGAQDR